MKTFPTRGLSAGSLYKVLFIGLLTPMFVFGLGCGIASYYGHSTVSFNGQNLYGFHGLVGGIILGVFLPVVMASLLWCLMWVGLWVWSRVCVINLSFKD